MSNSAGRQRSKSGEIARASLFFGLSVWAAPLLAYTPKPPPSTQPWEPDPEAPPHFSNLRYQDDYSYLDEHPEAREKYPVLRLKNIDLGDRWRLDIGGESRMRMEARSNQTFGLDPRTQDTQLNYRWLLHGNVKYGNLARLFVQGIFAHVEDQDGPFEPTQENHGDFQQLFLDLKAFGEDAPFTLRVGRQEFSYGNDRLVGPLEWVSTRRKFDAVKLMYESAMLDMDAFYSKPVPVKRHQADTWNEDYDFYGFYSTFKGIPKHGIDLYFFGVDRTEDTLGPNRKAGDQSIYTIGGRFWGYTGGWDYDAELAGQWGKWAGDTVQAWMWETDGGYTFHGVPWTPRVGAGFGWASGDENPFDNKVGTWTQLFPYNDVCIGILDLVGRQNMTRAYVNLDVQPIPDKLILALYFHTYWLNAAEDAYYNVGGTPILRDLNGESGVELGQEIDIWMEYRFDAHSSLVFGYSHFWDDNYVHRRVGTVTGDDDPDLFILQYRFKF